VNWGAEYANLFQAGMTFEEINDLTWGQFLIARRAEAITEEHDKLCKMIDKGLSVMEEGAEILEGPEAIARYLARFKKKD
jgi:hypothetical protein